MPATADLQETMGQVTVSVNGRTYRLQCGNGEEPRLLQLADYLRQRIDGLTAQFGQAGDERLTIMAALLMADELMETRERIAQMEALRAAPPASAPAPPLLPHELPVVLAVPPPAVTQPPVPAPAPPSPPEPDAEAGSKRTLRRPVSRS